MIKFCCGSYYNYEYSMTMQFSQDLSVSWVVLRGWRFSFLCLTNGAISVFHSLGSERSKTKTLTHLMVSYCRIVINCSQFWLSSRPNAIIILTHRNEKFSNFLVFSRKMNEYLHYSCMYVKNLIKGNLLTRPHRRLKSGTHEPLWV